MKKIIITAIAAIALVNISCEPAFLDNNVYSSIEKDKFYKNLSDFEKALVGCYHYISGRGQSKDGNYAVGIPMMGEAGTDECFVNTSKGSNWDYAYQLDQYSSLVSTNLGCQEVWINHYAGINAALEITDRIFAMNPEFLDNNPRYREIAGEACFLQALWYFNLVRIYGGVPLKFRASDSDDDLMRISRNTIGEVYEHIFKLLEYAKENCAVLYNKQYGRATKNSAYALSAKVNLTVASSINLLTIPSEVKLGEINTFEWTLPDMDKAATIEELYTRARDDARFVLDFFAPNYLMPNFTDCFYPHESSKEILFEGVLSTGLVTEMGGWFGSLYGPNGSSNMGGGQSVLMGNNVISMNQYTFYNTGGTNAANPPIWNSTDKRFLWTWATFRLPAAGFAVVLPPQIYNQTQIGKFRIDAPPDYNQDRTPVNIPILRTSEVCLIHAEAQAELDNIYGFGITADALEFLNVVRQRAGIESYTAASITDVVPLVNHTNTNNSTATTRGNYDLRGWNDESDIGHFRRAILNERQMELIGEGHRWHDLVRMGVLARIVPAVVNYSNSYSVANKPEIPTRDIRPHHIFRPIPRREISLHGGYLIQNYGYH